MISRLFLPNLLITFIPPTLAFDSISVKIGEVTTHNFAAKNLSFRLDGIESDSPTLDLTVSKIKPDRSLPLTTPLNIKCRNLSVSDVGFSCKKGLLYTKSGIQGNKRLEFGFDVFNLSNSGPEYVNDLPPKNSKKYRWSVRFHLANTDLAKVVWKSFDLTDVTTTGKLSLHGSAFGTDSAIRSAEFKISASGLNIEANNSQIASESLAFNGTLEGRANHSGSWAINANLISTSGAFYFDPIFVQLNEYPFSAKADLFWEFDKNRIQVNDLIIDHQRVSIIKAKAEMAIEGDRRFHRGQFTVKSDRLDNFHEIYLNPFFAATAFDGTRLQGRMVANLAVDNDSLTSVKMNISNLDLHDRENQFSIDHADIAVNVTNLSKASISSIAWNSAALYHLPFKKTALKFATSFDEIHLLGFATIPLLDGSIELRKFAVRKLQSGDPSIQVDGLIKAVSLERISEAFNWPAMSGTLSGSIPGVEMESGRLTIDGALKIEAFGGVIEVTELSVTDLLKDFPIVQSSIQITDIDLSELTQKFSFGNIDGKIAGRIKNLYLENWHPVSFDAWFGSPENDPSDHRISQKAVENLSSLGSGSVTDVFSKGILQFFDSFSYDRIGFGCRLVNDVCHLSGVGPSKQGYYIVKGGGLPRIDVIGYNHRIDWAVLIERLKRISQAENAQIK